MKFQIQGIKFLERNKGRGIVGDDMGVGKTLQVLGWLSIHPEARPAIIVCPANAKYEWEDQIAQHTHMTCQVLTGRNPKKITSNIIVINYDIISSWGEALINLSPSVLIMDECHYVKTRKIQRTKTCLAISKTTPHIIPMSGTPIINRPVEFFPVLNMMRPDLFKSFWKYAMRYCNPRRGYRGRGWIFDGATNIQELHELVSPLMIRRMKSEVLKELPQKRRIIIPMDLDNRSDYDEANDNFLAWYKKEYGSKKTRKAEKAESFVKLGQLKQLAARGKFKAACQWIDDFLETTDEKLVIFTYHRTIFNDLIEKYKKVAAVGGKAGRQRKEEVKRFQNDSKTRLFFGTIKADKEAITLTAASTVLFIEQGWTPGEHDQAEDRINRIGQKANKITAYYLLAKDSIDEYIWDLIEDKRRIVTRIIDGEEASAKLQDRVSLTALIKNITKHKRKRTA